MKRLNKFIFLFISIFMFIGVAGNAFSINVYAQTPNIRFDVNKTTVSKGDNVRVNILLGESSGITSLKLKLSYDANVLQLLNAAPEKLNECYFMGSEKISQNPYVMVWLWNNGCPETASLVSLDFKVSDTASLGTTKITVNVSEAFRQLQPVVLDGGDIYITISENTPGGDTPGGDTPGGNTPGGNTPGGDTPGGDTPGGDTPQNSTAVILIVAIVLLVIIGAAVLVIILQKRRKKLKTNDITEKENEDETMEN